MKESRRFAKWFAATPTTRKPLRRCISLWNNNGKRRLRQEHRLTSRFIELSGTLSRAGGHWLARRVSRYEFIMLKVYLATLRLTYKTSPLLVQDGEFPQEAEI